MTQQTLALAPRHHHDPLTGRLDKAPAGGIV
jgi:hypothetical protein